MRVAMAICCVDIGNGCENSGRSPGQGDALDSGRRPSRGEKVSPERAVDLGENDIPKAGARFGVEQDLLTGHGALRCSPNACGCGIVVREVEVAR